MPGGDRDDREIAASEFDLHSCGSEGTFMAFNHQQGLHAVIDPLGFTLGGPIPDAEWEQRTEVVSVGRIDRRFAWRATRSDLLGREVIYRGAEMDVQYQHGADGLRQNFIVHRRIEGSTSLRVMLRLVGDLVPRQVSANELTFHAGNGVPRFRYRDLKVWDADGRPLDARMELTEEDGGDVLIIVVDDRDARYPVTIDPISTVADRFLTGPLGGSEYGIAVCTAGDLNGDGFSDVVVGAWQATMGQTNEGVAYVYYGSSTGIPAAASVVLQSNQVGANLGCSVSTAGDVNGDGYSDLLVGARNWESTAGEGAEGAVFVYYGSATGINTVADIILQPNHANDNFGSNVACAGDINNDGYSDILVGAYLAEYPTYQEGAVFVYLGAAAGLTNTAIHRLERNVSAAHFGRSIAGAGDINGDGYSDVVVGAPDWLNVNPDAGAAFIYYGGATNLGGGLNPAPGLTFFGSTVANGSFGWSVACAGDVNGDGYSDVAVSAYYDANGQAQEGTVRVFHGGAGGLNTTAATVIESNQANAWLGRWVSTAGDMNGDGYADLLVGVELWSNPEPLEGAIMLYFGSALGIPSTASMTFELNSGGANVGSCVSTAGDVNGDGYSDMILGARIYGASGAAAIYHGGPYSMNLAASRSWAGSAAGNLLGSSVANAGDVNGDGYADAIYGAPQASNGQAGEGMAYLHLGSTTGLSTLPSTTLEVNVAGAQFGASVATAGDVNGDGYSDVIVGAPNSGASGRAYVFMGSPGGLAAVPILTLIGPVAASRFGASVSSAGDINSDGYSDVVIGAPDAASAYIHMGAVAGLMAAPMATVNEPPVGDLFGASVGTAGDVNGDGFSDVIIGAPMYTNGQTNEGVAFVYHGSLLGLVTPWATRLEVNQANANFGVSVAGAGDVNGNGFFDVVVGADLWESGQTDEGAAFVFYGSGGGVLTAGYTTAQRNLANGRMGRSVAEAGDINGDGYADIAAGAPLYDLGGQTDEGFVFVFRGSAAGLVVATWDQIQLDLANYQLGSSVSGGGDVDGDGYSDVLGGAPFASPTLANQGGAYWFRGNQARSLNRLTRQYDADLVTPLSTNSMDFANPNFFGMGHKVRSPIQRERARLRWEVVFEGQPFSGSPITNSVLNTGMGAAWTNLPVNGAEIKELIFKTPGYIRYKWRVREEYALNKRIDGQRFSRWFYGYAMGYGDIGVLPVELTGFDGRAAGPVNELYWTTATETNSARFVVERSRDGSTFDDIGSVDAAGESQGTIDYSFADAAPPAGPAYYRLRMEDNDGTFERSGTIAIVRGLANATLFPMPAGDLVNLVLVDHHGIARVSAVDDLGRVVLMRSLAGDDGQRVFAIDLNGLKTGHYTLLLHDGTGAAVDRLPLVKD